MKLLSWKAPIFQVLWIMLQPPVMWVCAILSEEFAALMFPDYMWYYGFPSGIKVGFAQLECALWDMIGVTIVGAIIVFRHKVGSRKFWIHSSIWYAAYLILTMSAIYCIAYDWGQVGEHSHVMISTMNCIYPPLVILILVSAVKVRRLLISGVLKKKYRRQRPVAHLMYDSVHIFLLHSTDMFHTFADEYKIAQNNVTNKQATMTHEDSKSLAPTKAFREGKKTWMAPVGQPPDR